MALSRLGWPTLVLLLSCVAAAVAVSKAAEEEPLAKPIQHDSEVLAIPGVVGETPPLEAVVAEIMRLREQQGSDKLLESGVFEPLPLESRIAERKLQLSAAASEPSAATKPAICVVSSSLVSHNTTGQIEGLRNTAKRLDEAAHVLECLDHCGRADEVRALAAQLRQDARNIRQAHPREAESPEQTPEFSFSPGFQR